MFVVILLISGHRLAFMESHLIFGQASRVNVDITFHSHMTGH